MATSILSCRSYYRCIMHLWLLGVATGSSAKTGTHDIEAAGFRYRLGGNDSPEYWNRDTVICVGVSLRGSWVCDIGADNPRILSSDIYSIRRASNIALLVVSAASVAVFVWWMDCQVKHNRTALMPNALWRNSSFTSICIMILFASAVSNGMELFCSLL